MKINEFSSGYYSLSMQVERYSDGPIISSELYKYINNNLYPNTDAPPLFRLGLDAEPYFTVAPENAVPEEVLAIPESWFDDAGKSFSMFPQQVYLCKPEYSYLLNQGMVEQNTDFNGVIDFSDFGDKE